GRRMIAVDDPQAALDFVSMAATDIHRRTARLAPALFGGANSGPELDQYLDDFVAGINRQVRRVLEVYRDRGWLRGDVPFDELVETAAVVCSVETYLRMTRRDGWSAEAYQAWCRRMLAETVFAATPLSSLPGRGAERSASAAVRCDPRCVHRATPARCSRARTAPRTACRGSPGERPPAR